MGSPELLYGLTLGMLAAVNPCGFPLLPTYLELFMGGPTSAPVATRVGRAVGAGACATVGFLLLFGAVGGAVGAGWSGVAAHAFAVARWAMVALGVGMVAAGVATLAHRPLRLPIPQPGSGVGLRRPVALVAFGLSYGIASLGCALPLFVSGVATTFGTRGALDGVRVTVAYALGMGIVLCGLALVVAVLGPGAARPLRRASRLVTPVGAGLLVVVGAYLTLYWGTELVDPLASDPVLAAVSAAQQHVASGISAHAVAVGAGLACAVVGGILSVALAGLRNAPLPASSPAAPSAAPDLASASAPTAAGSTPPAAASPPARATASAISPAAPGPGSLSQAGLAPSLDTAGAGRR